MPTKKGTLTPQEQAFAREYAATQDSKISAQRAGYNHSAVAGSKALARPGVQAEITRIMLERISSEILPLAIDAHIALLKDPKTPAGAKVQAVKLAYDRAFGEGTQAKAPHEMTGEELAIAIAALRSAAIEQARPIIEGEAVEVPDAQSPPNVLD